jgi:hypothetical protein
VRDVSFIAEDGSQLCHSHIMATSSRTSPSRLVAVLGSDLRDFIASGMLTLKAKIETVDEGKIIPRAAEVWSFFWAQVLPVRPSLRAVRLCASTADEHAVP